VDLAKLKQALVEEGVQLTKEVETAIERAFRKLTNPQGCDKCGMHVKVGVMVKNKLVTACCGTEVASPKGS